MKSNKTSPFISLYFFEFKIHQKIIRIFNKLLIFSQIFREALLLSLFSKKTIESIDNYHYNNSSKYLNDDYNRSLLKDWETNMVDNYFVNCNKIQVLAAGGGREVYALLKRNFNVDGYDCNKNFVDYAKLFLQNEGFDTTFEYVAPNQCPDNNKIYDSIILGWGAYNHIQGKKNRINLLKQINKHLEIGAPLLISYWWANESMDLYCKKLTKYNQLFSKLFFSQAIEKGDRLIPFSGHYFTSDDVKNEMTEAGFLIQYQAERPYGHTLAIKQSNQ